MTDRDSPHIDLNMDNNDDEIQRDKKKVNAYAVAGTNFIFI